MARKITYEQALVFHGRVALDPVDTGVIEKLRNCSKTSARERKGSCSQCWKMLLNTSRNMSLHGTQVERSYSEKWRNTSRLHTTGAPVLEGSEAQDVFW